MQKRQETDLFKALIRQGNSYGEANDIFKEMIDRTEDGEDPEEILYEFGLEPDYVFELINELI